MWILLAAVALIAVAVAIVVLFRRPSGDDIDSVRSYHSALGTLEHLADRSGSTTGPVTSVEGSATGEVATGAPRTHRRPGAPPPGPRARAGPGRSVPPVPVRGNDEFPDPAVPLVFDDARPGDRYRADPLAEESPVARDRAQRHALDSMNRKPRRLTTVLIVVVAVALVAALALIGSRRSTSWHTDASTATTGRAPHPSSGRTSVPNSRPKHSSRPASTTQPSQVVALTSTSTSATYPVVNTSYTITLTGTGTCWVSVTGTPSGRTLWAGELQSGTVQAVPVDGTATVQLGTPAVTLAVDHVPVVLPTPTRAPFVATFQPTAAALAASPPTTPTPAPNSTNAGTTGTPSATGSTTPP